MQSEGESLLDLLGARSGIVCAVGAGGKKTVLQHLAAAHPGRVAMTATGVTTSRRPVTPTTAAWSARRPTFPSQAR